MNIERKLATGAQALVLGCGVAVVLAACGGGGGGSSSPATPPSIISFPLATANMGLTKNGYSYTANITGTEVISGVSYAVTGTESVTDAPAISATFNGQPALLNTYSAVTNLTASISTVSGVVSTSTSSTYTEQDYSSTTNYLPLGYASPGVYAVVQGAPTMPATVQVGDTGLLANVNIYSDSTKSILIGTSQTTYLVEPDTTVNTAIFNITTKTYDASHTLIDSGQEKWRIDISGNMTHVMATASGSGVLCAGSCVPSFSSYNFTIQ